MTFASPDAAVVARGHHLASSGRRALQSVWSDVGHVRQRLVELDSQVLSINIDTSRSDPRQSRNEAAVHRVRVVGPSLQAAQLAQVLLGAVRAGETTDHLGRCYISQPDAPILSVLRHGFCLTEWAVAHEGTSALYRIANVDELPGRLDGVVKAAGLEPSDVAVGLSRDCGRPPEVWLRPDSKLSFQAEGLPAGKYYVGVAGAGQAYRYHASTFVRGGQTQTINLSLECAASRVVVSVPGHGSAPPERRLTLRSGLMEYRVVTDGQHCPSLIGVPAPGIYVLETDDGLQEEVVIAAGASEVAFSMKAEDPAADRVSVAVWFPDSSLRVVRVARLDRHGNMKWSRCTAKINSKVLVMDVPTHREDDLIVVESTCGLIGCHMVGSRALSGVLEVIL